jgi:hypothetical protein
MCNDVDFTQLLFAEARVLWRQNDPANAVVVIGDFDIFDFGGSVASRSQ